VRETTIVFAIDQDTLNVWQLSPLAARLLGLCDGTRTVAGIVREFAAFGTTVEDVSPERVCLFGLMQLRADGFIRLSASPLVREAEARATDARARSADLMLPLQAGNTQQPWPSLRREPARGAGSVFAGADARASARAGS
jgi:hypothetical protein